MMREGRNTSDSIERIRQRKLQRQKQERIRLLVLLIIFVVIVLLIILGIKALVGKDSEEETMKRPEPVNLMLYGAEQEQNIQNENFVYTEAIKRPVKHSDSENFDRLATIKANNEQKVCYLTFDDGPNLSITPQVLDVLRRYDVKATFFMVGTLIESNPDMARRVYEEGHLIANHSYSHNYKNIYASTDGFMTEINTTEGFIKGVLDSEEEYFPLVRFPGGSHNAGQYKESKQFIKEHLKSIGFYHCDWNSLNGDAEGAKKDADGLFSYFKKNTDTKKSVVVLMHDTVTKQATVDSLPDIIEYMKSNGYVFLRLDEDIN